jgi:ABC-type transporter Mla maintaining outer membrane lipid asymmetry ATPase subunit MlaF
MQGEVRILGQQRQGLLADDPVLADRLKVGMVFQNGALFDSLTVGENVGFLLYEHTALPHKRIKVRE